MVGLQHGRVAQPLHRLHRVAPHRVPQRAHDGGDQPVAGGVREGAVEGGVVLDELLGRPAVPIAPALRPGPRCRRRAAAARSAAQRSIISRVSMTSRSSRLARPRCSRSRSVSAVSGPGGEDGARVGTPPHLRGHHAEGLQHAHRLAHGRAADAELLGELPLGRQPVAHGEAVLDDAPLDLGEYVLERARLLDGPVGQRGLLGGHEGDAVRRCRPVWSDHTVVRPYPGKLGR